MLRHGKFIEDAASQLEKVWRAIAGCDAIDRRIRIGSEREKSKLGDIQPVVLLQTSDNSLVLEIGSF